MPELPEVETITRQLAGRVEGREIAELHVLDARWCEPRPPRELSAAVTGRRVERLRRRGKYIVWDLSDDVHLLMHLRMTGNLLYDPPQDEPPYTRVRIGLGDGHRMVFADQRRFGTGELALGPDALRAFFDARLGVEPLQPEFTAAHLRAQARGRRAPIKAFLLDQRRVAGVGNIYADEALHRARIHPLRPAGKLKPAQLDSLRDAVVAALQAGIAAGGATIDDYRNAEGERGGFQNEFLVYGREGEPCGRCGTPIRKLVTAGRGTHVCETCQPRPRLQRS